jgi:lantibiotic biosynthesis protein
MSASTQAAAGQQAIMIAEQLLDPGTVLTAAPGRPGDYLQSLAGTALMHARLAQVGPRFEAAARAHWSAAAQRAARSRTPGIFGAPGGLAASLILAEGYLTDPAQHQETIRKAVRWLSAQAISAAADSQDRARHKQAIPWQAYDTITGVSGTGRILLAALTNGHRDAEQGLAAALEMLTHMITSPKTPARPGWWHPGDDNPATRGSPHPGLAGTGMAHGISGPVALLSLAHISGYSVTGQGAAINQAATWLIRWQDGSTWPPYVTGTELDTGIAAPAPGRRDAWCYGTAGICSALVLAGKATGNPAFVTTAEAAVSALTSRPAAEWDCQGLALCHGYAGVLQATGAANAAMAITGAPVPRERSSSQHTGSQAPQQDPGFLNGAAGIALTLAEHADLPGRDGPTRWDAILLLA